MAPPDVPETLPCPEDGEPSKVLPHSPFRFPGIDPHQTRVIQCSEHGKQKVPVEVDIETNDIVSDTDVRGENQR